MARLLLSHGAQPNVADEVGLTPLHLAVASGSIHLVYLLLCFGADCMLKDGRGHSPLSRAQVCRAGSSRGVSVGVQGWQ